MNTEKHHPDDHALDVSMFDMLHHMETPSNHYRSAQGQLPMNGSPYASSRNIDHSLHNKKHSLEEAFKHSLVHQDYRPPAANSNLLDHADPHDVSFADQSILAASGPSPKDIVLQPAPFKTRNGANAFRYPHTHKSTGKHASGHFDTAKRLAKIKNNDIRLAPRSNFPGSHYWSSTDMTSAPQLPAVSKGASMNLKHQREEEGAFGHQLAEGAAVLVDLQVRSQVALEKGRVDQ